MCDNAKVPDMRACHGSLLIKKETLNGRNAQRGGKFFLNPPAIHLGSGIDVALTRRFYVFVLSFVRYPLKRCCRSADHPGVVAETGRDDLRPRGGDFEGPLPDFIACRTDKQGPGVLD